MIGKTTELPRALPLISPPRADELLSSWLTRIAQDYYIPPRGLLMVPLPYNIWAKQADDANTTPTVRMTGLRTHNMGSLITTCHGDEAGTGGGIKSGTHNGICEPMEHSATVRTEGKNAIRHNDLWWMNNRNTIGRLLWVKEPDTTGLTPQSQKGWQVADMSGAASPAPSTNSNTTLAFAPSAGFVAPEAATAGSGAASVGAGEATVGTGEAVGGGWLASFAWPLALAVPILLGMTTSTGGKQRADGTYEDEMPREKTEAPPAGRTAGNCNVSGQERKPPCPCITGPYDKIKDRCKAECGDGAQAHHIVPDGLLGVQNRAAREGALLGYRPRTAPRRCQRSMQGRPYACRATRRTSKPNTTPRIATTSRFTPRAPRAPSREPYPWAVPWTCRSLKPRRPGRTVQPTSIVRSTPDSARWTKTRSSERQGIRRRLEARQIFS